MWRNSADRLCSHLCISVNSVTDPGLSHKTFARQYTGRDASHDIKVSKSMASEGKEGALVVALERPRTSTIPDCFGCLR